MSNNFKSLDARVLGFIAVILLGVTSACVPALNVGGGGEAQKRSNAPTGANNNGTKPPVTPIYPNQNPNPYATPNPYASPNPYATPYPYQTLPPSAVPTPNVASDCYKATPFVCKIERLIAEKTNKYRAAYGKPTMLTLDPKISFVSRDWSAQQARDSDIGHDGFPSMRKQVYQREFNSGFCTTGMCAENVAMNGMSSGGGETDAAAERIAETFTNMWWSSSGHKRNMVGGYSKIGVGMAKDSSGYWYGTQIFEQ